MPSPTTQHSTVSQMKKFFKRLMWTVTTLVVLLVAAIIIIPLVIDPNDYKDLIAEKVKEKTGRTLTLDGNLSLSIFPWLGVSTEKLTLSQPDGLSDKPFISVDKADIKVKLFSLLGDTIEVDTVVLKKPSIEWIVANEELNSLTGMTNNDAPKESESQGKKIALQGIDIVDGQMIFDDRTAGKRYQIDQLNLQAGNLLGSSLAPVTLSGQLSDGQTTTEFELESQANIALEPFKVTANDSKIAIVRGTTQVTTTMNLSLEKQLVNITNAKIVSQLPNAPEVSVELPKATAFLEESRADLGNITISAGKLVATLANTQLKDWDKTLMFNTSLSTNTFDARPLLPKDFKPSHKESFGAISVKGDISGSPAGVSLQKLSATLDKSQITGDVSVMNFAAPSTRFDLSINQLNADHYLPAPTAAGQSQSSGDGSLNVPLESFQAINANGNLKLGNLVINNLKLSDIQVNIASKGNRLTVTPKASLYQGKLGGSISFTEGKTPTLNVNTQLTNVDLEPLLTDMGATDQVQGRGTIDTKLTITGLKANQTRQGTISIAANNGMIKGFDLKKILEDTQRRFDEFRGKEVPEQASNPSDETRFSALTATLNLNNNTITNNDLDMKAPGFRVGGKGEIQLAQQTLNYLLSVTIVRSNDGQGGADRSALEGVTIPIRIKGPISNPSYKPDVKALIKANLQKEIDEEKARAAKRLGEKLGVEVGDEKDAKKALEDAAKEKVNRELERGLEKLFK